MNRISPGRALVSPTTEWLERELARLVNEERQFHALSRLVWDDALAAVAREHSADEAVRGYYAHRNPEGESHSDRFSAMGYAPASLSFENLHCIFAHIGGHIDAPFRSRRDLLCEAHHCWMTSPGHRKAILHPENARIGVGVIYNGSEFYLLTQNFTS